jgi:hypothetical protein
MLRSQTLEFLHPDIILQDWGDWGSIRDHMALFFLTAAVITSFRGRGEIMGDSSKGWLQDVP